MPSPDPPKLVYMDAQNDSPERPALTSLHGHPQMTRLNDPPKQVDTDALKQPARMSLHGHRHD